MRSKCSPITYWRILEIINDRRDLLNVYRDCRFMESSIRVVVRFVPLFLHCDKHIRKILNFLRKGAHNDVVATRAFGRPVLQGAIRLHPCELAPLSICAANQQIGAAARQRMKQRIISGTCSSAEVGFSGPVVAGPNQIITCF